MPNIIIITIVLLAVIHTTPGGANGRRKKQKCRNNYKLSDGDSVDIEDSNTNRMKKCIYKFKAIGKLNFALTCDKFEFKETSGCK